MPNYADGKIYCIRNRADNDKIVYIGSTVQTLANRMSEHRKDVKRHPNMKLYILMAGNGVDNFHIELLADFPCQRKEQLLAEEGRHIRFHNTTNVGTNKQIPGQTSKEWRDLNRDVLKANKKEYYEANKADIQAKSKSNYEAHKGDYLAKNKEYYDAHKQEISAWAKMYRDAHKEELKAKKQAYQDAHKEERAKKERERRAQKKQALVNGSASVIS